MICDICKEPKSFGHGTTHLGPCENALPDDGKRHNVAIGYGKKFGGWVARSNIGIGPEASLCAAEAQAEHHVPEGPVLNAFGIVEIQQELRVAQDFGHVVMSFPPIPRYNVLIGKGCESDHHHCVLIGIDLKSDRPWQLKIGNAEVTASRDLTHDEFDSLYSVLSGLFGGR